MDPHTFDYKFAAIMFAAYAILTEIFISRWKGEKRHPMWAPIYAAFTLVLAVGMNVGALWLGMWLGSKAAS